MYPTKQSSFICPYYQRRISDRRRGDRTVTDFYHMQLWSYWRLLTSASGAGARSQVRKQAWVWHGGSRGKLDHVRVRQMGGCTELYIGLSTTYKWEKLAISLTSGLIDTNGARRAGRYEPNSYLKPNNGTTKSVMICGCQQYPTWGSGSWASIEYNSFSSAV